MKILPKFLCSAALTLFAFNALAQSGSGMGGMQGPGMGGMQGAGMNIARAAPDCAKARDPQRCAELEKTKQACAGKAGAEKKKCMQETMPPMDCSKSRNPQRCEDHQKAKEACKDKTGRNHKQCIRDNMPKKPAKKQP